MSRNPIIKVNATPRGRRSGLLRAASDSERRAFVKALDDGMTEEQAYDMLGATIAGKEARRVLRPIDRRLKEEDA